MVIIAGRVWPFVSLYQAILHHCLHSVGHNLPCSGGVLSRKLGECCGSALRCLVTEGSGDVQSLSASGWSTRVSGVLQVENTRPPRPSNESDGRKSSDTTVGSSRKRCLR